MTRSKYIFFSSLLVLIGLGIGFVGIESIVRIMRLAPPIDPLCQEYLPDPFLPYKPKPFLRFSEPALTGEFIMDVTTNSMGFRDVEHSTIKQEDVFRIVGVGDSFTYGAGARFEETYLYQLEHLLNADLGEYPQVEIIKAGISRYFPEPERLFLEHYAKDYAPDLILVGFLPNDVIETHLGLEAIVVDRSGYLKTRDAEKLGAFGVFLYKYSHVARLLFKTLITDRFFDQETPVGDWNDVYKSGGFYENAWQTVEQEYQKMIALARKMNAKIVFVHIPQQGPWRPEHFYPAQRLAEFTEMHDVGFVDILPDMIAAPDDPPLYYPQDGHCTPAGYAVIARAIYDYLRDEHFILR